MVASVMVHPAFEKAAHYFGIKMVHVPVTSELKTDVKALERAINRNTILIVGSAPSYPHGIMDPIEEMGEVATRKQLPFHVGEGPWVSESFQSVIFFPLRCMLWRLHAALGGEIGAEHSAVGLQSPRRDLHLGRHAQVWLLPQGFVFFSPSLLQVVRGQGASVILYRNSELRSHQFFAFTDWPGGLFCSPSMAGSRPGGNIAAGQNQLSFSLLLTLSRICSLGNLQ